MKSSTNLTQPRLVLFFAGAISLALAIWHFATRGELVASAVTRAAHDLNGLSMLFAGVVTVAVAWMAVSTELIAGYAGLYGLYLAGYSWILFFSGISRLQAILVFALAVAAFFAASNAWTTRRENRDRRRE